MDTAARIDGAKMIARKRFMVWFLSGLGAMPRG
jgi:hypothetical protein